MTETTLQPYLFSISIISAEGMSKGDSYYVTVSIEGGDQISKQMTPTNEQGDGNPKWNHEMSFMVKQISVQQNLLSVVLKIHDRGSFFDKCVGEVCIPMKEMIGDNKPVDVVTFQLKKSKYQIRKPKGEIKISYQITELAAAQVTAKPADEPLPEVVSVVAISSVTAKPADELVTSSLDDAPTDTGSIDHSLPGKPQAALAPVFAAAPVSVPQADPVIAAPAAANPPQAAPMWDSPAYPHPVYQQGAASAFPAGYPPPGYQQNYGYLPQFQVYGGPQPGYGYQPQQPIYYPTMQQPPKKNKFGVGRTLLMAASFLGLSGPSHDEILDIGPPDLWSAFADIG